MKFLSDATIKQRLTLLVGVIFVGLVLVGSGYGAMVYFEEKFTNALENNTELRINIEQSNIAMLQSRRNEKDFLMRHDEKYIERHALSINALNMHLDKASNLTEQSEIRKNLEEVRKNTDVYQKTFIAMTENRKEIGLNEKSGLHGALRNSVHNIEEELKINDEIRLTASMLMLRRHEKDYMARLDGKYIKRHQGEYKNFIDILARSSLVASDKKSIRALLDDYENKFLQFTNGIGVELSAIAEMRDAVHKTEPALEILNEAAREFIEIESKEMDETALILEVLFAITMILITVIVGWQFFSTYKAITAPLKVLNDTVVDIMSGKFDSRSNLETRDELGDLGRAFDSLLDDRLEALKAAEIENDKLNDSIIDILEAVAQLSERDLTVKVPIAEDVTGPVADAMNLLARNTANVLSQIHRISGDVAEAANIVRLQGNKVTQVANEEKVLVSNTMDNLDSAASTMNDIAQLAQSCNSIAETASAATSSALLTVNSTVDGMSEIRETISETEKRIKRLGERSQEITSIVEIINNIAERTHVLALNASMQAAVAGEAGRGFAVVADEVQRLAESSRSSTSQIASLVNNIRTETAETMATMNRTIEQVIAGSNLAEQAGKQMQGTMDSTSDLVSAVDQMAARSLSQAATSNALLEQAKQIQQSTEITGDELMEQGSHADNLVMFSKSLIESVGVFKLPATQ